MNDVVTKPIHMDLLFKTLQRLIPPRSSMAADAPEAPLDQDEPAAADIPTIAGIDTEDGLARSGGNVALYRDLLRRFAQGHRGAVQAISKALERGDTSEADRVAHTLKGVSGNIGAREVHELAGRFRRVLEQGDEAQMKELLAKLGAQLGAVMEALQQAVEPAPEASPDAGEVDIEQLRALIADSDSEATDWLTSHRSALAKKVGEQTVAELVSALDAFDFERAQKIVSAMGSETAHGN